MAVDLIIAPEVEQDLAEVYTWYEARRTGLGEEFLSCVDAGIRRFVRRFPHAVFYEYTAGMVTVYGVLHTSRDPEKWRQRLP